eukprot:TRINITY_DN18538_c0_g1_i1.p1 TRINITY_DN18538_c0_g1~~TRINITY_DN18538_c0_g1_i1.p1  ORF type:complete len:416 (-),score=75.99 TRINITY_DN18538_c0_g1_i1:174-1421(-)
MPRLIGIPERLVQEIIEDGCCPLHLRLQLASALEINDQVDCKAKCLTSEDESSTAACTALAVVGLLGGPMHPVGGYYTSVSAYLEVADVLAARAVSSAAMCGLMQRPDDEIEDSFVQERGLVRAHPVRAEAQQATADTEGGETADAEQPRAEAQIRVIYTPRSSRGRVHDGIRCRLWLQRLYLLTKNMPDERVFETMVRSYVDEALRRRLTAEVEAARTLMEEEVREAKATMLQCVQAISEEVDRRVREKVHILQEEFDRRANEQVKALQDAVERRVGEQTAALRAEVDRRSDCVRAAVEARARAQEDVAKRLQDEVVRIRQELESRVGEQEDVAGRLALELSEVRRSFQDLVLVRHALEERLLHQERASQRLRAELAQIPSRDGSCLESISFRFTLRQMLEGCLGGLAHLRITG